MRQPDSVSNNPSINDRLRVRTKLSMPNNGSVRFILSGLFLLFFVIDLRALKSFFNNFSQQGPGSYYFWMFLAVVTGVAWLLWDTLPGLLPQFPSNYRKQRIPVRLQILQAILMGTSMLSFLITLLLYTNGKLAIADGDAKVWGLALAGGLIVLSGVGYLIFQYGNQALQPLVNLWQRVSITGYFDREAYEVGDTILFQMRDRLTIKDKNLYRVHLQYVQEYEQSINLGQSEENKQVRQVKYHDFIDVSGEKLYAGVRLPTLRHQRYPTGGNQMSFNSLNYWEVLVEEHSGDFYGRFFVNLVKFRPKRIVHSN